MRGALPGEPLHAHLNRLGRAHRCGQDTALAAFERAYPGVPRKPMPALWEEPSCVAEQDGLWFFFDHCASGEPAKVIRIVARRD